MALSTTILTVTFLVSVCGRTVGGFSLEVTSPAGTFVGTVLTSPQGGNFRAFLGIPYALPPVGNLRFAKPKPYPKLNDTFEATRNAPICIQCQGVDLGSPVSEDCLYLNVYTPMYTTNAESSSTRKVFVYIIIHGGGSFMGSANEQVPGDWVTRGEIIVVTLNYRLGWLGFVKGNTPEAPGNMGVWDQLMALNWVKDNIRSFGGDPDDITIGGQSAGSGSVSLLTITPHSKDLFTKAVMLSFTVFQSTGTPGSSDHLLYELADAVGCDASDKDPEDVSSVLRCLKQAPAEAFSLPFSLRASEFVVIDGDLLPAPIPKLINDQDYLTSVGFYSRDYIISVTSNEGLILLTGAFDIGTDKDNMEPEFFHRLAKIPLSVAEKTVEWYQDPNHFHIKPSNELYGDTLMMMPTLTFAEVFASVNKAPVILRSRAHMQLVFADRHIYWKIRGFLPTYMPEGYRGFFHAMELCYIFDLPPDVVLKIYYHLHTDKGFTEDDWNLKRRFIDAMTEFIKTGNPDVSLTKRVDWPKFDLGREYYLQLTPEPMIKQFPLKQKRDFWKKDFVNYIDEFMMNSKAKEEL